MYPTYGRTYQLLKSTSDPKHQFCNFGTGNLKTLQQKPGRMGINILQELRMFFEKQYSSERMQLVVLGKGNFELTYGVVTMNILFNLYLCSDSLDELQSMVVDRFSAVPARGDKVEVQTGMPHLKTSLPAIYRVVPGCNIFLDAYPFPLS